MLEKIQVVLSTRKFDNSNGPVLTPYDKSCDSINNSQLIKYDDPYIVCTNEVINSNDKPLITEAYKFITTRLQKFQKMSFEDLRKTLIGEMHLTEEEQKEFSQAVELSDGRHM